MEKKTNKQNETKNDANLLIRGRKKPSVQS